MAELPRLVSVINKNKANDNLRRLLISCSSMNPKLARILKKQFQTEAAQLTDSMPSPLDTVDAETRKRIEELRKKTRGEDA